MTAPERSQIASHISTIGLCGVLAVCAGMITHSVNRTLLGVDKTVATINAPCTSFHGSVSCGVLAQLSQTEKNTGILAAQGAESVNQSQALVKATTRNLDSIGASVTSEMVSLKATTDTTNATIADLGHSASVLLGTANQTVEDSQPLLANATALVGHADSVVTDPDLKDTMHNFNAVTLQAADVMADTEHVTHKYAYPPKTPWYTKGWKYTLQTGELVFDFVR